MATALTEMPDGGTPIGALNTTPLIDIMLVLLVMFIITMPLQTHAVKIPLPSTTERPIPQTRADRNTVSIAPSGQVGWNGQAVDTDTLRRLLDATRAITPEPELHIAADPQARYARVDEVLAVIRRSNVAKVGFVDNEKYATFGK